MKPRIILAGGRGFLGQLLSDWFHLRGWEVGVLTRTPTPATDGIRQVEWDGASLANWTQELEGAVAVINLAGRSVDCRYTQRNRDEILRSRLQPTRVLGEAIARCHTPPGVWLNSSTATIYRHSFSTAWDESGEIGGCPEAKDEFSVLVAMEWERVFAEAQTPGTRKAALRTAMVLGLGRNSVLPTLLRLARFGLAGRMGSGRQFVSWIHAEDFCRAVEWITKHDSLAGAVNLAAPNPVTNQELMAAIRELSGMPLGLPATRGMLELGALLLRTETELILKSRRVIPGLLLETGFTFQYPDLRRALQTFARVRN